MKNEKLVLSEEMVGTYINRVLWSDVMPLGRIVSIKSKTKVLVQRVKAGENKVKMEFVPGGFAGHCVNNYRQDYDFYDEGQPFELSLSRSSMKRSFLQFANCPMKHHDYNF